MDPAWEPGQPDVHKGHQRDLQMPKETVGGCVSGFWL